MKTTMFKRTIAAVSAAAVMLGTFGPVMPAAAAIADGANALNVLGQADFGAKVNAVTQSGMYGPEGLLVDSTNERLYVADASSNRGLVFDVASITDGENAANVLGQPNFTTSTTTTTQSGVSTVKGFALDSGNNRLYMTDAGNRRLPVFDVSSITDGENATDLLGQFNADNASTVEPDYTKGAAHGLPHRVTMGEVHGIAIDTTNNRLFVSDNPGHRILVYNLSSTNTFPDYVPDNVLGQPDFDGATSATTQAGLKNPKGLAYHSASNTLYVADNGNNRVLVYDVASITNGESAVNVLGQANFTSGSSATSQAGLNSPKDVALDLTGGRLFVPNGNRVIVYDIGVISNGENAVYVLGQSSFTGSGGATGAAGMNTPYGVHYESASSSLMVADASNNRVTFFDVSAITNGESAVNVLGQADLNANSASVTQLGLSFPTAVTRQGPRLFVADYSANRVMVFDVTDVGDGEDAVNVLGQTNFTSSSGFISQSKFFQLFGLEYNSTNDVLLVGNGEGLMGRVSQFDAASITDGENATALLGQFDDTADSYPFATTPFYTGGFSSSQTRIHRLGYDAPQSAVIDTTNHRLFVVDKGNNTNRRVLVYTLNTDNTLPDRIPDFVLGNSSFRNYSSGTSASSMTTPEGLAINTASSTLFVSDSGNNRITVFDVSTVTSGESAVNVLGQSSFGPTGAATTATGLSAPKGMVFDSVGNRLFVADSGGNRVVVYDVASISNGEAAVNVLGQANFTASSAALTQAGMSSPRGVAYHTSTCKLFVSDTSNNRVLVFDAAPSAGCVAPASTSPAGQARSSLSATPYVKISPPAAIGLTVKSGSTHSVFWTATGSTVSKYRLSFSTDGGKTWRSVAEGTDPLTGYYGWKVPKIAVKTAKLKLELLNSGGTVLASSVSDAFRIAPARRPKLPPRIVERLRALFAPKP